MRNIIICLTCGLIASIVGREIYTQNRLRENVRIAGEYRNCRTLLANPGSVDIDVLQREMQKCVFKGYLSVADIQARTK